MKDSFGNLPQRKRRFTRTMWDQWRAARQPDHTTVELREGIQTFRALLATRDVVLEYRARQER